MTPHELTASTLKKLEHAQSGTARAALLGISDGLVTNVSLILGIAGAGAPPGIVRVAGVASLIAGALSMAVGEYISMQGQVELLESVLKIERKELHSHPDSARQALCDVMIGDGMEPATAAAASGEIARNPEKAMAMYARGKLGVNPDELGSAWQSAVSSLLMFAIGAFIPLVPWFFSSGNLAVTLSIAVAILGALTIGTYLGLATTGRWVRAATRQLLVLILAAGATYLIGRLFHTAII